MDPDFCLEYLDLSPLKFVIHELQIYFSFIIEIINYFFYFFLVYHVIIYSIRQLKKSVIPQVDPDTY